MPVPCQESEWFCICVLAWYQFFLCLYKFQIEYWNCSDGVHFVVLFAFHSILKIDVLVLYSKPKINSKTDNDLVYFQVLQLNINSQQSTIDNLNDKAENLKQTSKDTNLGNQIRQLVTKYEKLLNKVKVGTRHIYKRPYDQKLLKTSQLS